jgi:predicted dehydrogenase
MIKPLKVALVGCGMAAGPHARSLQDLSAEITVAGVYSRTAKRRAEFARQYGFDEISDLVQITDDDTIDAVIVITPPDQRMALVDSLAAAGKHLLMEKPLERGSAAAQQIVDVCQRHEVKLGVVLQHRFRNASMQLKALIDSGDLGQIGLVQAMVPWWREQSYYDEPGRGSYQRDGGGVLISQAIHTLDLMMHLCGPVAQVQSMAATTSLHQMESEDFVAAGLMFDNAAPGSLMATTAAFPGSAESLTIVAQNATAHLAAGTLNLRWRDGRTDTIGEGSGTGGGADPMAFPHDWHRDLIADFAAAIRESRHPGVSGADGLRVHRLIDALIQSSRDQRLVAL